MNEPAPCQFCKRPLSGPVNFCPYCGKAAATVETIESPPSPLPPPIVKLRPEENTRNKPEAVAPNVVTEPIVARPAPPEESSKRPQDTVDVPPPITEVKIPPLPAKVVVDRPKVSPPDNDSPRMPAPANPANLPKKRGVGVYVVIALVIIVAVVAAKLLLFSKPTAPVAVVTTSTPSERKVPAISGEKVSVPDTMPAGKIDQSAKPAVNAAVPKSVVITTPKQVPLKEPLPKQSTSGVAKKSQEGLSDDQIQAAIQDAINLYDDGKYAVAAEKFREIQAVKPNNALVKFYLPKCLEAAKQ